MHPAPSLTAVMVFHQPADVAGFDDWVGDLMESARVAPGFASWSRSAGDGVLDCAVAVEFSGEESLHRWLDGAGRRSILDAGQARGFWRRAADLVLGEDVGAPTGVDAFRHVVAPGKESDFLAVQQRLATASAEFSGYECTALLQPESGNEWLSVLRFRTANQLEAWLRSADRDVALPGLRSSLSEGFSAVTNTTPFATTVRVQDGRTLMTPNWKSALLVLLVLYPTVMVLSRFVGPLLDRAGAPPWLAVWVSQIVSISALQWWLMPAISRPFHTWLDPVDGAGWRSGLTGTAVIVVGYAVTLAVFASVPWLQFWDYAT